MAAGDDLVALPHVLHEASLGRSTQGNPINSNTHKNAGPDGSTFNSFKVQVYKPYGSSKRYGKGAASAATSDTSSTVAD